MKKKLLSTIIAFMAIAMSLPTYAQISQEAAGTYDGQLAIKVDDTNFDPINEKVYLTASDDTHATLEIRNFSFPGIPLGDIVVSDVELQRDGNTIILAPKEVDLNLIGEIGKVKVSLEQSTIKDNKLLLSLSVAPYSLDLDIHVGFEGTNTSTGISNTSADNKPVVYYDSTRDALITSKAENQKYGIYNVTGMQMISGIVTTNSINVSNLSKGLYLIKIGDSTMKFIKK